MSRSLRAVPASGDATDERCPRKPAESHDQPHQRRAADLAHAVLREVGPRLRAGRLKRDLTLDQLAEMTGISASTLSRLESGHRAPNLELLLPVTRVLRISLDDLLMWRAPDPRVQPRRQRFGHLTVEYLSPATAPIQTFKMTLAPTNEPIQTRSHDGYEWCYVLRGRARVMLGEQEFVIEAGQAAEFDTRIPHGCAALDGKTVEILSIFNRSGERIHLPGGGTTTSGAAGAPQPSSPSTLDQLPGSPW